MFKKIPIIFGNKIKNHFHSRFRTLVQNSLEITHATIYKGKTGETIKRHSSKLIPYLTDIEFSNKRDFSIKPDSDTNLTKTLNKKPKRKAFTIARDRIRKISF